MSALSPAPAPTSGVRWTDLPTPLDSALPSCCLSYKQSALLPPLCFHNLTNPFSPQAFWFHIHAKRPGVGPLVSRRCSVSQCPWLPRPCRGGKLNAFSSLQPLFLSWLSFSSSSRLFSDTCSLFSQNTRGGGKHPDPLFGLLAGGRRTLPVPEMLLWDARG